MAKQFIYFALAFIQFKQSILLITAYQLYLTSFLFCGCRTMIINFWEFYVFVEHLAASVKPGGHLHNTVVEIAIQVIDRAKTHGKPIKRVLPLRVAVKFYIHSYLIQYILRAVRFYIHSCLIFSQPQTSPFSSAFLHSQSSIFTSAHYQFCNCLLAFLHFFGRHLSNRASLIGIR